MDDKAHYADHVKHDGYPEPDIPADEAWDAMQQMLQHSSDVPERPNGISRALLKYISYACAGIIAVLVLLFYSHHVTRPSKIITVWQTANQIQQDSLPNGTICFADEFSQLQLLPDRDTVYTLTSGGVFFPATENNQPVRLQQGSLLIEGHHGGFLVQQDSAGTIASVHVQKGFVLLTLPGKSPMKINEGESIHFNERENYLSEKGKVNPNLYSYATLVFEFNDTPLPEAAALIGKAYGVTIQFSNGRLLRCRITTRLDNKTLQDALDIIGYTLNFTYTIGQQKKIVYITGEGCE
ncbi:MAG: DUF4974 domain-containing protein [Bacteroidetes bacterium]|nr:DUF4974 domain-containing protein [Bacteroidota bacterium]